jgi:coenzyme F420-reducing hydrogenase delta subunit
MRLQYPPNINIVRVPCTGKVDVLHLMRSIEKGADGVCVIGCLEGECHYNKGNLMARRRVEQARKLLDAVGVGADRIQMFNLSSSEAPQFVKYANEMTARIKELGPNPIKNAKSEAA